MACYSFADEIVWDSELEGWDVEAEDLKDFEIGTNIFNPYDPHCIRKNRYVKVYHPWIHRECHLPKEDPWRYFYNSSNLN